MKELLLKILYKLVGELPDTNGNVEAMQNWLYDSHANQGQKNYHRVRITAIKNALVIGTEEKEYWKLLGRVDELRALNDNIAVEAKRRKEINKSN